MSVALVMGEGTFRRIDGDLRKIGPTQARELRIQIREQAALQQRVVGEVDAWRHVGWAEGHLFGLGKEVVGPAVEYKTADFCSGTISSGMILVGSRWS
jgi:hypothetical protein